MLIATDPLSLVFIGCFTFGMLFLIVTALLGNLGHGHAGTHIAGQHDSLHVGGHVAGGHGVGHAAGHAPVHAPAPTHAAGHAAAAHGTTDQNPLGSIQSALSFINITSIVFFLIGFGLFGYVFHNTLQLVALFVLALAGVSGIVIAALLLLLLSRLFGDSEGETIQDVSDRTGMVGKVSMTIQENSLGEVIYISPGGMRKSIPARSIDGRRLERDQEVVIINSQHGVAEVDTWDHFIGEEESRVEATDSNELEKLRALLKEPDKADTELVIRKDLQKE
jgi:membrane protein implicated in regulation of membrane protease activity